MLYTAWCLSCSSSYNALGTRSHKRTAVALINTYVCENCLRELVVSHCLPCVPSTVTSYHGFRNQRYHRSCHPHSCHRCSLGASNANREKGSLCGCLKFWVGVSVSTWLCKNGLKLTDNKWHCVQSCAVNLAITHKEHQSDHVQYDRHHAGVSAGQF
jgi:hypothetical protein